MNSHFILNSSKFNAYINILIKENRNIGPGGGVMAMNAGIFRHGSPSWSRTQLRVGRTPQPYSSRQTWTTAAGWRARWTGRRAGTWGSRPDWRTATPCGRTDRHVPPHWAKLQNIHTSLQLWSASQTIKSIKPHLNQSINKDIDYILHCTNTYVLHCTNTQSLVSQQLRSSLLRSSRYCRGQLMRKFNKMTFKIKSKTKSLY